MGRDGVRWADMLRWDGIGWDRIGPGKFSSEQVLNGSTAAPVAIDYAARRYHGAADLLPGCTAATE